MLKHKQTQTRTYWKTLSDEELLSKELTTDDPEKLQNLVSELPEGFDDSYVEYAYDFRNSGRDELTCIHGHHRHRAGFVMRKGDTRWLVGWICAQSIYGEKFDEYTADYDAAVIRHDSLTRRRELESWILPFITWMEETNKSDIFRFYDSIRKQFQHKMPWIWQQGRAILHEALATTRFDNFFDEQTDLTKEFADAMLLTSANFAPLIGKSDLKLEVIVKAKTTLLRLIAKVEQTVDKLAQLADLFQPKELDILVRWAKEGDNPKKRTYSSDLNSITCKRGREKSRIQLPTNFRLPDRLKLDELKKRLEAI